ncbi:hypothetical protein J6590_105414 [Homalodisca vitripennis]|nr:hypothetical protein J6590_105414 [Homalodisca vitripennis]
MLQITQPSSAQNAKPSFPKLLPGDTFTEVYVIHRDPDYVSVTTLSRMADLKLLSKNLQEAAATAVPLIPQHQSKCLAKWSKTNTWFRGRVVSLEPLMVNFVDNGNTEICTPENLKELPAHLNGYTPLSGLSLCHLPIYRMVTRLVKPGISQESSYRTGKILKTIFLSLRNYEKKNNLTARNQDLINLETSYTRPPSDTDGFKVAPSKHITIHWTIKVGRPIISSLSNYTSIKLFKSATMQEVVATIKRCFEYNFYLVTEMGSLDKVVQLLFPSENRILKRRVLDRLCRSKMYSVHSIKRLRVQFSEYYLFGSLIRDVTLFLSTAECQLKFTTPDKKILFGNENSGFGTNKAEKGAFGSSMMHSNDRMS